MTHAASSPVTRETNALYRRRPLVATITAHMLVMREKGRRDRVEIPLDAIYDLGMKIRARALLAEKKARRQARNVTSRANQRAVEYRY